MSLSINWQHSAVQYGVIDKFGSSENAGKLASANTAAANNRTVALKNETVAVETKKISMEDFLTTLRDNLMRVRGLDSEGNKKDVEPLLNVFASAINHIEEVYDKAAADMAMGVIAQGVGLRGASERNITKVINEVLAKFGDYDEEKHVTTSGDLVSKLNAGLPGWGEQGESGLAKALSYFYYNDRSDEKYTLSTMKVFETDALVTRQMLTAHEDDPDFMPGYYSELEEEYEANNSNAMFRIVPQVNYSNQAFEPADPEQAVSLLFLKDQWYAATLQATAMADAKPELKPVERRVFIEGAIHDIINGEIESELSDEMRDKVAIFSQLKAQVKQVHNALLDAWEASGITGIIDETIIIPEEINAAYRQFNEVFGQIRQFTDTVRIKANKMPSLYQQDNSPQPAIFSAYA